MSEPSNKASSEENKPADPAAEGEESFEELDPELEAALERADAQVDRGEGIPIDEAFARLRRKYFGGERP
jgi:hypothetical protein